MSGWERFPWLLAGFSTREGGSSQAYGEDDLNLGWTESDLAQNVAANRARFLRSVAEENAFQLATVSQFHSAITHVVGPDSGPLLTGDGKAILRGDGLITAQSGTLLAIQTADCVPVLVADIRRRAVAAFHAGWRGTLARIIERGVSDLRQRFGSEPGDLVAAIGPCIGRCCFEVGEDVRTQFEAEFPYSAQLFVESHGSASRLCMDLVEANRRQLLDAGLSAECISVVGECTSCTRLGDGRRKYFSYRAEAGFTGRMMSVIGVMKR